MTGATSYELGKQAGLQEAKSQIDALEKQLLHLIEVYLVDDYYDDKEERAKVVLQRMRGEI